MKAAFLDRDGVINEDFGYVGKIEDFKFKEGIFDLLKLLENLGFTLFIVTNQSGIARGYYSEEDFYKLTEWMKNELKKEGIKIKDVRFCPHHPDITGECECRKPKPGMILDLAKVYDIDLKNSIMVGDSNRDIEAAKRAGICRTYLVEGSLFNTIDEIKLDYWNDVKKLLNKKTIQNFYFKPRDVMYVYMGQNIGSEQYGKGKEFLRPVLVYKKLSKKTFLAIPLTTREKKGSCYYGFYFKNKKNIAMFNQIKVLDIKRIKFFYGKIGSDTFKRVEKAFLKFLTPQKEEDNP